MFDPAVGSVWGKMVLIALLSYLLVKLGYWIRKLREKKMFDDEEEEKDAGEAFLEEADIKHDEDNDRKVWDDESQ
jgi:hypothetical protein